MEKWYETLISPQQLAELMSDSERKTNHSQTLRIFDCRFALTDTELGRNKFTQSHIPGASYLHLDEDLSGPIIKGKTGRHPLPEVDVFTQRLSSWGVDANTQVIAYDDMGGAIASRLWWMLGWLGHDKVAVLDGGFPAWETQHPVESQLTQHPPKTFIPKERPERKVDADVLEKNLEDKVYTIVDSRGYKRYLGEEEPIDPIAGHIPGALNYPFTENMEAATFLSPDALAQRFKTLDIDQTVFYCGSGVTAAHNLLALRVAGLGNGILYPGSWSDWITTDRPIATGEEPV